MSLTDQQKMLVSESFTKVAPIAETAAELFYGRLFEIDPDIKPLFKETDMKEQGRKLMQTIATAVGALYRLEDVVPEIKNLGRRHIAYGVTKEQYATVGEALLWALEKGLGDDFTPEVKEAWTIVYTILADTAMTAYDSAVPKVAVEESATESSEETVAETVEESSEEATSDEKVSSTESTVQEEAND